MLGMSTPTGQKPKAALNNHSLLQRATRSDLRRITSDRLLKARELNGYTQTEAAKKFGYNTPAQLSQWEMGRRMIPMDKLLRASAIYKVSLDYLMGVSEEPDRDPMSAQRLQILAAAAEMCEGMSRTLADAIIQQTKVGGPTVQASYVIVAEGDKFLGAYKRFVELNPSKFENMRGGNTLKAFAESFEHNGLAVARDQIERYARTNAAAVKVVLKKSAAADAHPRHLFEPSDA